jgi:hypothetical protein
MKHFQRGRKSLLLQNKNNADDYWTTTQERERERAKSGEDYRSVDLRVTDLVVVDGHRGELTVDIVNVLETTPGAIGFVFD